MVSVGGHLGLFAVALHDVDSGRRSWLSHARGTSVLGKKARSSAVECQLRRRNREGAMLWGTGFGPGASLLRELRLGVHD